MANFKEKIQDCKHASYSKVKMKIKCTRSINSIYKSYETFFHIFKLYGENL